MHDSAFSLLVVSICSFFLTILTSCTAPAECAGLAGSGEIVGLALSFNYSFPSGYLLYGLFVNDNNDIYVCGQTNSSTGFVYTMRASSSTFSLIASPSFPCYGIVVDVYDNVYYTSANTLFMVSGDSSSSGIAIYSGFIWAIGLAYDDSPNQIIYISDYGATSFADNGVGAIYQMPANTVSALSSPPTTYLSSAQVNSVLGVNLTGYFGPGGITFAQGSLYIVDLEHATLWISTASGSVSASVVSSYLGSPFSVAVTSSGDIYVADIDNLLWWSVDSLSSNYTAPSFISTANTNIYGVSVTNNVLTVIEGDLLQTGLSPSSISVTGDPVFAGFNGRRFQVHGVDGAVYCLWSSPSTAINALFKFIGKRPKENQETESTSERSKQQQQGQMRRQHHPPKEVGRALHHHSHSAMSRSLSLRSQERMNKENPRWTHPGNYIASISFIIGKSNGSRGAHNSVVLHAGPRKLGFRSVLVNDLSLSIGACASLLRGIAVEGDIDDERWIVDHRGGGGDGGGQEVRAVVCHVNAYSVHVSVSGVLSMSVLNSDSFINFVSVVPSSEFVSVHDQQQQQQQQQLQQLQQRKLRTQTGASSTSGMSKEAKEGGEIQENAVTLTAPTVVDVEAACPSGLLGVTLCKLTTPTTTNQVDSNRLDQDNLLHTEFPLSKFGV